MPEKNISELLNKSSSLNKIIKRAKTLNKIESYVVMQIEALMQSKFQCPNNENSVKGKVLVADYHGGELILTSSNSGILTQIRFLIPELMIKLKNPSCLPGIKKISLKKSLPTDSPIPNLKPKQLSPKSAQLLKHTLLALQGSKPS